MKKWVLFIAILFIPYQAFLQEMANGLTNKSQSFEYWAKRYNLEYTRKFLDSYKNNFSNGKLNNLEKAGYKKFISEYSKLNDQLSLEDLNEIYDNAAKSLSNGWGKTLKTFKSIDAIIAQNLQQNTFNFDALKAIKYKYKIKNTVKDFSNNELLKRYQSKYFKSIGNLKNGSSKNTSTENHSVNHESQNTPDLERRESPTENDFREEGKKSSFWRYLILAILFFAIGGFVVYFISQNKIKGILYEEYEKYKSDSKYQFRDDIFPFITVIRRLKGRKNEYKSLLNEKKIRIENLIRENNKQKNQIKDYIIKIESLENQVQNLQQTDKADVIGQNKQSLESKNLEAQKKVLYFSIPTNDGCFIAKYAKSVFEPRRFFRIEYTEGENVGKLFYISDPGHDGEAINNYDDFLEPSCEILNLNNREYANKVVCEEPGEVFLSDGKWCVKKDKLVKVKFI